MSTVYLSISELNQRVSALLERQIPLLWVQGEISNLTKAASGHWYFSLKDANAQVRAVMFRSKNGLLNWQPKEGDAVQAQVLAGLYPARGEFQLTVEHLRPAGLGTLFERFLQLKDELNGLGWFDAQHKKPLPPFVKTIGVITSPQAAALRDVVQTLARRAPHIQILLYPTLVQGDLAAGQISKAIDAACQNPALDALLLVRGGGSLEDLWAFNERVVAQSIKNARLPIVCGVGHETDTTIADFVADLRAETPTAAAERISSPSASEWHSQITQALAALQRAVARMLRMTEQRLDYLTAQLLTPAQQLSHQQAHLTQQWARLQMGFKNQFNTDVTHLSHAKQRLKAPACAQLAQQTLQQQQQFQQSAKRFFTAQQLKLAQVEQSLNQLNPNHVLARGYAYVRTQSGAIVYNAKSLQSGDGISIQFADGRVVSTVNHIE